MEQTNSEQTEDPYQLANSPPYQKSRHDWAYHKENKDGARTTVGECEVYIARLEEELITAEKSLFHARSRADKERERLDELSSSYHDLRESYAVLESRFDSEVRIHKSLKRTSRVIEIFLGIGCLGIGLIPSLFDLLSKSGNKAYSALICIFIALLCLAAIFLPTILTKNNDE